MNDIDALLLSLDAEPGTRLTPAETARSAPGTASLPGYPRDPAARVNTSLIRLVRTSPKART